MNLAENVVQRERLVVAMSGGVDSSAAALLLAEQGFDVVGIAMQVWDYRKNGGNSKRATCCAPADFDDARTVASAQGFPFYVFDFEDSFEDAVIRPFVRSYLNGRTPNPCIECNRHVKFKELRRRAQTLGAARVATGHYAQIKDLADGTKGLFTAKDTKKDQSYFLFALTQEELDQTLFPVGAMTKPEVREYLADHGLHVAHKPESQDICFVSGSVGEFIEQHSQALNENQSLVNLPRRGAFVTSSGEHLGEHEGIFHYTVGQRKGLGLSDERPLYVLGISQEKNEVQVGFKEELAQEKFFVEDINWISGVVPMAPMTARVKLRYRHKGVLCEILPLENSTAEIRFLEEWTTVSPGQAAVFYAVNSDAEGDYQVLGGGTIANRL